MNPQHLFKVSALLIETIPSSATTFVMAVSGWLLGMETVAQARENCLLGHPDTLPPVPKGQEKRPRW